MNHGPIVVNENGFKAMSFSADFKKYAAENGIRDPFEASRKIVSKHTWMNDDGSIFMDIEFDENTGKIKEYDGDSTRAEKDAYIKMRDEYVARRCFYEIGYESFLAHTKKPDYECSYDISYLRDSIEFIPCKSADHQCTFDCMKFAECALNGTWKPD